MGNTIWMGPGHFVEIENLDGVLGLEWARDSWSRPPAGGRMYGWFFWRRSLSPGENRARASMLTFNRFGFGFHVVKTLGPPQGIWRMGNRRFVFVYLPYWFLSGVTALLPLRWLVLALRQRPRNREGYCPSCGYNLTGNITGICSECGAAPDAARAERSRRVRRTKRAIAAVVLIALAPIVGHTAWQEYRDHLAKKAVFAYQHRLLQFSSDPRLIVYAEDPALSQRLLASNPHYVRIGIGACYIQDVIQDIHKVPGVFFGNGPPVLFLHERRSPDRTSMLVAVSLMALDDFEDLRADLMACETEDEPGLYHRGQSQLVLRRWPREHMTFLAGQPDPADPSHFTMAYRLDEKPGTIDGWLMDGGWVKMQVRDGPAQALAASSGPSKSLPFIGPRWGGAPTMKVEK